MRTLIRLGVAQRTGVGLVSVAKLAAGERIPVKFLENILAELKAAGYVQGVRGKSGGARLVCDPAQTKMGELIRFMDGKLAPISCASETAYEPCTCPDEAHCGLRMLMIDVRNAVANILDRYTLGDVVTVTLRKLERDGLVPEVVEAKAMKKPLATRLPSKPRYADPKDGFLAGLVRDLALK